MTRRVPGWALVLPVLIGCSQLQVPKLPELPDLSALSLPTVDGKAVLIEYNRARLLVDPGAEDALVALGRCVDSVTYCVAPPDRSLGSCVSSVPSCSGKRGDSCCPAACKDQFAAQVQQGVDPLDAFDQVFFRDLSCDPEARALAGVTP